MARYLMMQTQVPPNITKLRNTKLHGARSNELAFQSTDFCVPENLIFPALLVQQPQALCKLEKV